MLKDLPAAVHFYGKEGLGLALRRKSDMTAEFETGGPPLVLKAVEGEAMRSTGAYVSLYACECVHPLSFHPLIPTLPVYARVFALPVL